MIAGVGMKRPDGIFARLLTPPRYRYTCPHCQARLPRAHFFESETHPCEMCGKPITPSSNDAMTYIFALGFVLLFSLTMFLFVAGSNLFVLGVFALAILCLGLYYVIPYVADFHAAPLKPSTKCPRCRYDIRATPEHCPECGLDIPKELQPDSDQSL
jgi:predicted amidophosphoribosyltransferase